MPCYIVVLNTYGDGQMLCHVEAESESLAIERAVNFQQPSLGIKNASAELCTKKNHPNMTSFIQKID